MGSVLFADDSALMLKVLKLLLANISQEFRVLTAQSGTEAIDIWKAERPLLTVLDMHMPGLNGMDVLRHIKELDATARVVMLSADRNEQVRDDCLQLGAEELIMKGDRKSLRAILQGLHSTAAASQS